MSRFTVVVTDDRYGSYAEEECVLSEIGATLEIRDLGNEAEAIRTLASADGILVNLFALTAQIIETLPKCRVISRYGVGCDNVDVAAATRKGIWVTRVPDYAIEDVSDHALALLLACVRKVAYRDRRIREGRWNLHKDQPSHRIAGKTLGFVGYGAIARRLHAKVSCLRARTNSGLRSVCLPRVYCCGGRPGRGPANAPSGIGLRLGSCAAHSRDAGLNRREGDQPNAPGRHAREHGARPRRR